MKNILFSGILLLLVVASCVDDTNKYTINGSVTGKDTGWVFLHRINAENKLETADSAKLDEGKFTFTGKVESPELYLVTLKTVPGAKSFFLENSIITINVKPDSMDKSVVAGSKSNDDFTAYTLSQAPFQKSLEKAYANFITASQKGDTTGKIVSENAYDSVEKSRIRSSLDYIMKNNTSVVAAFIANNLLYELTLGKLDSIVNNFSGSLSKNKYVVLLKSHADILRNVATGRQAPEIIMNDTAGKPVKLSSLKGKTVLIDFWASWCGPCRAENPNVAKAYKTYSEKGFTVFGVSLDENKGEWLAAIKKDGLTWYHVSDLKGWANTAAKQYGVTGIPDNFLLDKDGKIIASDLRGKDLEKKLDELFNPPAPTIPVTSK